MSKNLDVDLENNTKKTGGNRPPERKEIGAPLEGSRISYGERNKITVHDKDPDFVYRVVNHDGNRFAGNVEKRLKMGYIFAKDGETVGDLQGVESSQIGNKIGTHVGNGIRGILMKIPRKYYEQDQLEKQVEVDSTELGMVDDELQNPDMYGEGLTVADGKGTRLEVKVRKT